MLSKKDWAIIFGYIALFAFLGLSLSAAMALAKDKDIADCIQKTGLVGECGKVFRAE